MENKLEIKFRNQKQSFEILEDEVLVDLNTSKHKLTYTIALDEIKKDWHIAKGSMDHKTIRLYTSLFLNLYLVLCLIIAINNAPPLALKTACSFLIFPFVFMLIQNTKTYKEKHIDASKLLYFIYTKDNAEEVDEFITAIYQKQREYFRKKYFVLDAVLPFNLQQERYLWLYTNNYINENEYEVIKEDLDQYFNFKPTIE